MVLASDSFCDISAFREFENISLIFSKQMSHFPKFPENKFPKLFAKQISETTTKRNNLYSNKYDQIQRERKRSYGLNEILELLSASARVNPLAEHIILHMESVGLDLITHPSYILRRGRDPLSGGGANGGTGARTNRRRRRREKGQEREEQDRRRSCR